MKNKVVTIDVKPHAIEKGKATKYKPPRGASCEPPFEVIKPFLADKPPRRPNRSKPIKG